MHSADKKLCVKKIRFGLLDINPVMLFNKFADIAVGSRVDLPYATSLTVSLEMGLSFSVPPVGLKLYLRESSQLSDVANLTI